MKKQIEQAIKAVMKNVDDYVHIDRTGPLTYRPDKVICDDGIYALIKDFHYELSRQGVELD